MTRHTSPRRTIEQVRQEIQERIIRHMQADTCEEDERRQQERDARIRALLEEWAAGGELPGLRGGEE
jgi:hypothetical protein